MKSEEIRFENGRGERLAARLDRPEGEPRAYALFAHCFTCSKDVAASSRVSRSLAERGIAVLRFDFTGLGGSDGDLANESFSSNVQDLEAAARHLAEHYAAPRLLVGHSLGGAAVLVASSRIESVAAVATIGAPSDPAHVRELLTSDARDEIRASGRAPVRIAGRQFELGREFLEDLDRWDPERELGASRAALLVMHSPLDEIVPIEHAERIYRASRGFRSFVSLGTADHLLSDKRDARYAADVLGAWASRYVEEPERAEDAATVPSVAKGEVLVEELERPFTNRVVSGEGRHVLLADEPAKVGGADRGPSPYDYLLAALGTCTSMTLRMVAEREDIPLQHVSVRLRHERIHAEDCEDCETKTGWVARIDRRLTLTGELTEEQRARLRTVADRCPVHRTLEGEVKVRTTLE